MTQRRKPISCIAASRWLLSVWLFFFLPAGLRAQPPDLQKIDRYIEQTRKNWNIPGMSVAIVHEDRVVFARGYGLREIGRPEKVDEHTLFAIASNTKAFTAALLGLLVEAGKVDFDARVIDYLPAFRLWGEFETRDMRVRDLITHRSGLPTFGGDHLWIGNRLSSAEILRRLRFLQPSAPLRTRFQYQNLMFMVAGQIIPAVSGESWAEALQKHLLGPLGMNESNSSIAQLAGHRNVARPHEIVDGSLQAVEYDNGDAIAPAGAINSNVLDMTKWMRMNMNGGMLDGKQILPARLVWEMQSVHMPMAVSPRDAEQLQTHFAGYGLGWFLTEYRGYKIVRHGGGLTGMISLQTLLPEKKLGIIVLTNFAPDSPTNAITNYIIDAFLGGPEYDWSAEYLRRRAQARARAQKQEQSLQARRVAGTKPTLPLQQYTGTYVDSLSGPATVRLENGQLVFDYNPRHIGRLEHWHYDTFRVHWQHQIFDMPDKAFLTFYLDENGQVTELKTTFYDPIAFRRTAPASD